MVSQQIKGSQFRLRFHLQVETGGESPSFEDHGSTVLRDDPVAHFRSTFGEIEAAKKGNSQLAQVRLSGLGIQLAERLLPNSLRSRLWKLQQESSSDNCAPRLCLISNETAIPWELLKVTGPQGGNVASPFLVEAFAFTRWLTNVPGCLLLPLKNIALVIPRNSGLPGAEAERKSLQSHASSQRKLTEVPAQAIKVLDEMASGHYDGWHYCGHGFAGADNPDLWALNLDGNDFLKVADISNARGLGLAKPLVFLNTCRSGQGVFALTNVGSWAKAFVEDARAGAFLGALWAVGDAPAAEFAKNFYTNFLAGMPVCEVMRSARQHVKAEFPGDPSWLAFTLFAAPEAVCARTPAPAEEAIDVSSNKEEFVRPPDLPAQPGLAAVAPEPTSGRPVAQSKAGFDVFLSYNSEDLFQVESIATKLEKRGVRTFLDRWDLRPGTVWKLELQRALKMAPSAIVFVGRGMGPWHERETLLLLTEATFRGIPIIPALLPRNAGKPVLPDFLADHQWVELHSAANEEEEEEELEQLIWGIRGEATKKLSSTKTKPSRSFWKKDKVVLQSWVPVLGIIILALGVVGVLLDLPGKLAAYRERTTHTLFSVTKASPTLSLLRGELLDAVSLKPLARVKVWLPEYGLSTTTDELGLFEFEVPVERNTLVKIRTEFEGYQSLDRDPAVGQGLNTWLLGRLK